MMIDISSPSGEEERKGEGGGKKRTGAAVRRPEKGRGQRGKRVLCGLGARDGTEEVRRSIGLRSSRRFFIRSTLHERELRVTPAGQQHARRDRGQHQHRTGPILRGV